MKRTFPRTLYLAGATVVILYLALALILDMLGSHGWVREVHYFPGTTHPNIEIRTRGVLRAGFDAYVQRPFWNKRLFQLPGCSAEMMHNANSHPRVGEGVTQPGDPARRPRYEENPMYDIVWSSDGRRVAFARGGWYIAAYDLNAGTAMKVSNQAVDFAERDRAVDQFISGGNTRNTTR